MNVGRVTQFPSIPKTINKEGQMQREDNVHHKLEMGAQKVILSANTTDNKTQATLLPISISKETFTNATVLHQGNHT